MKNDIMLNNFNINSLKIIKNLNKKIKVEVLEQTTSTNDYIKKYLDLENCAVIAKSQTSGRGRLNRSFYSPSGTGLYMSVLVKPNSLIANSVRLTTYTAVVVAKAIESLISLPVQIKWVNDLFLNGKKICGILAESSCNFEKGTLNYAIIGIGVNVYNGSFPLELESIATSIEKETNIKIDINALASKIINGLLDAETQILSTKYLEEYKKRLFILNKKVTITSSNGSFEAVCVDVLDNGALVANKDSELITVHTGDVSIRF